MAVLLIGGSTFSARPAAAVESPAAPSTLYPGNRPPLAPSPFVKLPVGAITPQGWLRHQLEAERDGMTGHLEELSPFLDFSRSSWADPEGRGHFGWEEFPYWIKGYGDLGYVLGDEKIIANAKKWLQAAMATQREDGYFGPRDLLTAFDQQFPDMWPQMPILNALQSYYEFSGDRHVIDVMTRYFHWQDGLPAEAFGKGFWPRVRMSDNIESVHWLYNRTGEPFLLGLADKIYHHAMRWNGITNWHNVNIAQGFRMPTVFWEQSKDDALRYGAERNYRQVTDLYGQFPGGGFAGDEICRPGFTDPRQGFETCGMVEFMHSFEMLTKITGESTWADRCEDIAFNSFPAAMTPDLKALHYLTSANMVQLDKQTKFPGLANRGMMVSYSPFEVYRCCQHNHGMGWPYYAEELWLGTPDGGVCASLYAASTVRVKVGRGNGREVRIEETTDYPFSGQVTFKIDEAPPEGVTFPLFLRIPEWCAGATVSVNGRPDAGLKLAFDHYVQVSDRRWDRGDVVELNLPMKLAVKHWSKNKDAVSVSRGPLTYSLEIAQHARTDGNRKPGWPETEVYAAAPWNYGLTLEEDRPLEAQFEVIQRPGPLPAQPFTPETTPITLKARARKIAAWQQDRNGLIMTLQASPAKSAEPVEVVSLIPMGAARLRITAFPTVSEAPDARPWQAPPPRPPGIAATASHVNDGDSTAALSDGLSGKDSADETIPRFTWWDHRGTSEWVEYDFGAPRKISAASVQWFDDTGSGYCRVPQSWRLLYKDGEAWKPVQADPNAYEVKRAVWNRVAFPTAETTALRLEVELQPEMSGGILEWKVE